MTTEEVIMLDEWLKEKIVDETKAADKLEELGAPGTAECHRAARRAYALVRRQLPGWERRKHGDD